MARTTEWTDQSECAALRPSAPVVGC
jgi:hypothetical protein